MGLSSLSVFKAPSKQMDVDSKMIIKEIDGFGDDYQRWVSGKTS